MNPPSNFSSAFALPIWRRVMLGEMKSLNTDVMPNCVAYCSKALVNKSAPS
jgi:hypothetical protein